MVTACTNTGASLFLGTPVKPSGKKSAATSPMKDNEMNHSRFVNILIGYFTQDLFWKLANMTAHWRFF